MDAIAVEIVTIFLLLIANGVFAMSEIAIVSARKPRLQQWADRGSAKAGAALQLADNPNQFLATVQIGITLIGILAGAFSGATVVDKVSAFLSTVPVLEEYSDTLGFALVVVVLTYFSLIIGELVPKRIALGNAEKIASSLAKPMRFLSSLASPVVWLLSFSTDRVMRLLRIEPSADQSVSEEEIRFLIEQGTASGVFVETEQDMIESILRLDERRVGAFMTPRPKIVWFAIGETSDEIRLKIEKHQFSRYPVIGGELDNVLGFVRVKDLVIHNPPSDVFNLQRALQPPLFIPESMPALEAIETFRQKGMHIALVVNEYGGVEGLITHHDILEAIVGDIEPARGEPESPQAVQREDGSWLLDGSLDIDELKDIFDIDSLPDEETGRYHTAAGFCINQVRRIPQVGEHFTWQRLRFEVVDMDGNRVDKLLVTALGTGGEYQ